MRASTGLAAVAGVFAVVVETHGPMKEQWSWLINPVTWIATIYFAIDLLVQTRWALAALPPEFRGHWTATLTHMSWPTVLVDAAAALVVPVCALAGVAAETAHLLALVWLLKLARYASGLSLLGRVVRNSAEALFSVLLSFAIVLVAAATLAYLAEAEGQPEQFGSIPLAIWWAIVTLTTTGYGDTTPVTLAGRILAGTVMVCGIGVFALWAGIIASGFSDELKRRDFLLTWELVAKVPFFRDVGADLIAAVARLLRRRDVSKGQVFVRRGQPGEAMFFIVSGEVEVQVEPLPVRLDDGQFFGELALITGAPRSATVVAVQPTVLLELDVADFRQLTGDRPELIKVIAEEAERRAEHKGSRS
jgi:voltage-gated potassium channel